MFWDWRSSPYPWIVLHIKYEPPTRPRTLAKFAVVVGGGGGGWVVKRHFRVPLWSKPWT